jgi:hypothetical protein
VDVLAYAGHHRRSQAGSQRAADVPLGAVVQVPEEVNADVELDHRSPQAALTRISIHSNDRSMFARRKNALNKQFQS